MASLRLANDYFVNVWPDPTTPIVHPDRSRPATLWTRAVYYEGLMGLYEVETDPQLKQAYYDYAVRWGEGHDWQTTYATATTVDGDHQACGQTYIDLYLIDPVPARIAAIEANIRRMVNNSITNSWTWIDAIQMAMPVFAKLGVLHDDPSFFNHMWAMYAHTRNVEGGGLYNPESGLWWRDADFSPGGTYLRSPNNLDIYWSRGNGWVIAALVRVLDVIPANEPRRAQYEADFRALATALVPLQRSDGFWNTSLTDPTHCAEQGLPEEDGPETSGTALFVYGLAWGIRVGLLDAATYGPVVSAGWRGLNEVALQSDGFLGYVQSTGREPCDPRGSRGLGPTVVPNFDDYGVGCFLLAGSEVYKLAK